MNEVKAFIRKRKAEQVIDGLEAQGFCCMTLIDVMGLGRMSERFTNIVKLVVVCSEKDTERVVEIIRNKGRSGQPGDGIIYVTPVSKSVHIRSGDSGSDFLQHERRNPTS